MRTRLIAVAAALLCAGPRAQQALPPAVYQQVALEVGLPGSSSEVTGVALCDLDGDGRLDAAFTERYSAQAWLYLGFGDASFAQPTRVNVGASPQWLAAGDMDGDGRVDLVTANADADSISVLLGDGAGGASSSTSFAAGDGPQWVTLADVDSNGTLDVLVADEPADAVTLLRGDGHGGVLPASTFGVFDAPHCVATGDFNEDGKPDFVSANTAFPSTLTVRLGDGAGSFGAKNTFQDDATASWGGGWVGVAQTDADAHLDLVVSVTGPSPPRVVVRHGQGDGSFPSVLTLPAQPGERPCLPDLDGDGHVDLLMQGLQVALGDGAGGFGAVTSDPVLSSLGRGVAAGDLDGDGHPDAVELHDTGAGWQVSIVTITRGDGAGGFELQETLPAGSASTQRILPVDLDADGDDDVLSLQYNQGVTTLLHAGSQLASGPGLLLGVPCSDLDAGDLDGDGDPDAVVALADSVQVLLDDGAGAFTPKTPVATGSGLSRARCGDADADGDLDVFTARTVGGITGQLRIFLNDGHAGLSPAAPTALANFAPMQLLTADFNEDGKADLAVLPYPSGGMPFVSITQPGAVIPRPNAAPISFAAESLYAGDVNGDGHIDLVPGSSPGNASLHAVLPGHGDGTFGMIFDIANLGGNGAGFVRDVDGDGIPDLVAVNEFSLAVLRGDGTAAKWTGERYLAGTQPVCAAPLDLDGDGLPEIVVGEQYPPAITLLRRRPAPPWSDWGHALAGSAGKPQLVGLGSLQGGTPVTLKLSHGKPLGSAVLVIGNASIFASFKGGTLVPLPSLLIFGLPLDAYGHFVGSGPWYSGLPSGSETWFQAWIPDAGGPKGFAATNAVRGVTP